MIDEPLPFDGAEVAEVAKSDDAAARQTLRESLETTRVPGTPMGTVDDLVAMSSPPWHTACPNPFLADWIDGLEGHSSDAGRHDPGPYLDDVTGSKATLQYKAHSYATKVPPEIIARLIMHFTEPGDVVLDGFAGSGMTGVAASLCANPPAALRAGVDADFRKRGRTPTWGARRAVLNDLAPLATFIAAGVNLGVDAAAFALASARLLNRFDEEYGWMYETTTPQGDPAVIDYTVWSEVFTCPHCGGQVVFYDRAFDLATRRVRGDFSCGDCGGMIRKKGPGALERRKVKVRTVTGETIERIDLRPVSIHYRAHTSAGVITGDKALDSEDQATLARVNRLSITGAPTHILPINDMTHGTRLAPKGFTSVQHLFSDRALVSLSVLWAWANQERDLALRRALVFWVEQAIWGLSWMNRFSPTHFSHVNQYLSGVYYVGSLIAESSVRYTLEGTQPVRGKRANLVKLWHQVPSPGNVMIGTGSSSSLPLPGECIDYIFVDPPFGENIPYADLAQLIEAWHRVFTDVPDEAIVDVRRKKGNAEYEGLMKACFAEFARVLKPGRWMTVEFSNSSNEIWAALQSAIQDAGFVVADTRILDKAQDSYRQATASNAVKQDLMLSCYKPHSQTEETVREGSEPEKSVWSFVGEHLRHLPVKERKEGLAQPVRERFADRLYDRTVAYFVSRGASVPMTAAEFYRGLDHHFLERDSMYFLPDQAEEYERFRITFKELAQAYLFVTDEKSAIEWLRQQLKRKPSTYAQIQPVFLQQLPKTDGWNELPDLLDLLESNFLQDDQGRWIVPDPKKSEHMDQLRTRELLRVFKGYTGGKGPLKRFRGEAVAAGFKQAWADRDYTTITEVGGRIPNDVLLDLPALLAYVRNARSRTGR